MRYREFKELLRLAIKPDIEAFKGINRGLEVHHEKPFASLVREFIRQKHLYIPGIDRVDGDILNEFRQFHAENAELSKINRNLHRRQHNKQEVYYFKGKRYYV